VFFLIHFEIASSSVAGMCDSERSWPSLHYTEAICPDAITIPKQLPARTSRTALIDGGSGPNCYRGWSLTPASLSPKPGTDAKRVYADAKQVCWNKSKL
jgi:hypothetical protein